MRAKRFLQNINTYLKKNKKYIIPAAILGGFIFDMITLTQIDRLYDNIVLITHLTIIGGGTLLLISTESFLYKKLSVERVKNIIETIIIFSFGAIFSGFIIFYTRSGSLTTSWPFIATLIVLMLSTEFTKNYYKNTVFRISLFYLAVTTYNIFAIPILLRNINTYIFYISILISIAILVLYLKMVFLLNTSFFKKNKNKIITRIAIITISIILLFSVNILPPAPLSIKFQSVYYTIEVIERGNYLGVYQKTKDSNFLRKRSRTLSYQNNAPIFIFTSIFAPKRIQTNIYHTWEYKNQSSRKWIQTDRIPLSISGGRPEGYRGFTKKNNIFPGKWRVIITNEKGQRIGVLRFSIQDNVEKNIQEERI